MNSTFRVDAPTPTPTTTTATYIPYQVPTYQPSQSTYQPTQSNYRPTAVGYAPTQASYFPFQHPIVPQPTPYLHRPASPTPPDASADVASRSTQKLISAELKEAGFDAVEPAALGYLEGAVVEFVERLYKRTHDYANLANRSGAIATDLMLACNDFDIHTKDLRDIKRKIKKRRKREAEEHFHVEPLELVQPESRSPTPELLGSDDEGTAPIIPATIRTLPPYYPSLPPKHTYLQTPASPPKKAAIPSLEKKLKTASLVQDSLRSLMVGTEDTYGQEDAELLGHIVNWETSAHPRKRWKFGAK